MARKTKLETKVLSALQHYIAFRDKILEIEGLVLNNTNIQEAIQIAGDAAYDHGDQTISSEDFENFLDEVTHLEEKL